MAFAPSCSSCYADRSACVSTANLLEEDACAGVTTTSKITPKTIKGIVFQNCRTCDARHHSSSSNDNLLAGTEFSWQQHGSSGFQTRGHRCQTSDMRYEVWGKSTASTRPTCNTDEDLVALMTAVQKRKKGLTFVETGSSRIPFSTTAEHGFACLPCLCWTFHNSHFSYTVAIKCELLLYVSIWSRVPTALSAKSTRLPMKSAAMQPMPLWKSLLYPDSTGSRLVWNFSKYEEWRLLGCYAVWFLTRSTRRNIPEDAIPHNHRRESPKSYIFNKNLLQDTILYLRRHKSSLCVR
jgi:hypothetical protein